MLTTLAPKAFRTVACDGVRRQLARELATNAGRRALDSDESDPWGDSFGFGE
jgi:hypothetical protein